jgi:DNA mismatch repair protein MutS
MQVLEQLTNPGTPTIRGKRRGVLHSLQQPTAQLSLFDAAGHPLLDEIRSLDLTRMTPLEALTTLHRWQQMIQNHECE